MKQLLFTIFFLLVAVGSANAAHQVIPDILLSDESNPNWVDGRRYTDIEDACAALVDTKAILRINKDMTLDSAVVAGDYSELTFVIPAGKTLTISRAGTYSFNIIGEVGSDIVISNVVTLSGNVTLKYNSLVTISNDLTISGDLYVDGVYNAFVGSVGTETLVLTGEIDSSDVASITNNLIISGPVNYRGPTKEYANIAALRALTVQPSSNSKASVLGYSSIGDGGNGLFYWDAASTTPDNSVTAIKITAIPIGRWIRLNCTYMDSRAGGIVGDGITDDHAAWTNIITALPAGAEVYHDVSMNSYLNTSGGLIFTKQIKLSGFGSFTIGATTGNFAALRIEGENSYIRDITIIGDSTNFTNSSSDLRYVLNPQNDNIVIDNVTIIDAIGGVNFASVTGGKVINCKFQNSVFNVDTIGTYPDQNHAIAVIVRADTYDILIDNNDCIGHGTLASVGYRCNGIRITNNTCKRQSDNGIYAGGIGTVITGNTVKNSRQAGIKGYYSNSIISDNTIITTGSYTSDRGIYYHPLHNVTGQPIDSDGNTSYDTAITGNSIRGVFNVTGIHCTPNNADGSGFRNITVNDNVIDCNFTNTAATSGPVGIFVGGEGLNLAPKFEGVQINDNTITNVYKGIHLAAANSPGFAKSSMLNGNTIINCIANNITLQGIQDSVVSENICKESLNSAITTYGMLVQRSQDSVFRNNIIGNIVADSSTYAISVDGTSSGGFLYDSNEIYGITNYARHYDGIALTDRLLVPNVVRDRSVAGDSGFYPGEAHKYNITATNPINLNSIGVIPNSYDMIVNNYGATTITFDSAGIAVTLTAGQVKHFMYYNGWKQVQ